MWKLGPHSFDIDQDLRIKFISNIKFKIIKLISDLQSSNMFSYFLSFHDLSCAAADFDTYDAHGDPNQDRKAQNRDEPNFITLQHRAHIYISICVPLYA